MNTLYWWGSQQERLGTTTPCPTFSDSKSCVKLYLLEWKENRRERDKGGKTGKRKDRGEDERIYLSKIKIMKINLIQIS